MILPGTTLNNRFTILDTIAEGGMSTIYKAQDSNNNITVALKLIEKSKFTLNGDDIIRFRSEIEAIYEISHANIIKILDHGQFEAPDIGSCLYIALEYLNGKNLTELMHSSTVLPVESIIKIIIQVCNALEKIHDLNIIHGDIKPSNIMLDIHSVSSSVKLIDFGLARLKKYNYNGISGTFLYMPPEQAGLLRLPVDERSDLYSLGVLFYQLLTGELPFYSETLISLLHEQLSQLPLPPSKVINTLPPVIDSILLKLLDKEPDNRYQSSAGLRHDLEKFLTKDPVFIPGEYDIPKRLSANTSFIGRDDELKKLFAAIEKHTGEIASISGEGGIGKSRLVEKIYQYTLTRNITYLEGKCYNRSNTMPYAALHDILSSYARHYFRHSIKNQERITAILRNNLGDLGNIIINFNPLLKSILGEFPSLVGLDPETEKRRFFLVISNFLLSIAEAEGMLIITLEDIHWADAGTMEFLLEMAGIVKSSPVKILLTFRNEELKRRKEIYYFADKIFEHILPESKVELNNFDKDGINHFIPRFIQDPDDRKKITEYIYLKSQGNPLFTTEIIKYLIIKGIFIKQGQKWLIDFKKLSEIKIPDSIVEIILGRVNDFKDHEADILSQAAVIGKKFKYTALGRLLTKLSHGSITDEEIISSIDKALSRQIIEHCGLSTEEFAFTHDRIHDAFYHRIKTHDKKNYHLTLARIIEESGQVHDEYIFDLAYHYISGKDNDKILQYALPAANISRKKYVYAEAIKYYEIIKSILEKRSYLTDGSLLSLWTECIEGLGISYAHQGRIDEAVDLFQDLLTHITLPVQKATIYQEMSRAYFRRGDLALSEHYVHAGLSILKEKMPLTKGALLFFSLKELLQYTVSMVFPSALLQYRSAKKIEKTISIIKLYEWLNWVYFFGESIKSPRTVLRMINLSKRTGKESYETAISSYYFSFFYACIGWYKKSKKYLNKSLDIMQMLGDRHGIALCLGGFGFYYVMKGDFKKSIETSKKSIQLFENIGNAIEISKSGQFLFSSYYLQSDYSTALFYYNKYKVYLNNIFEDMTYSSFAFPILYYIETGEYQAAEDLLNKFIPHQERLKTWFLYYTYLSLYGYCLCEQGRIKESLNYFEHAESIFRTNYLSSHTHMLYPHYTEALIEDYLRSSKSMSLKERKKYLKKIRNTFKKAIKHTKHWNHSYDSSLRAAAKGCILEKKYKKAEHYFNLSLSHSKKTNRRYEHARTLYEYGLFLKNRERHEDAKNMFLSSYTIFDELGINKFRELILKILDLKTENNDTFLENIKTEKTQYTIKKSRELLHIQELDDIIYEALSTAMIITGASGSHLFLYDEGKERLLPVMSRVLVEGKEQDYSLTIIENVFNTGQVLLTSDASEDENLMDARSVSTKNLKSILCVPLRYNELINGVCYLDNPLARGVFKEDDIELLTLYLSNAALAIENRLLHERLSMNEKEVENAALSDQGVKYVNNAIEYLKQNLNENLTRENVAKKLDINADYFGKIFKTHTGKSFKEYLNETRVQSTLDSLANTDNKIIDIAFEAGFESIRTFYRIFYRIMGETPTSYREKN